MKVVGAVVNDWQLSGIFTGWLRQPLRPGLQLQHGRQPVNLTGSPDFTAAIVYDGDDR